MARHLLLTAVGWDRPGLVAGLTEVLAGCDCNVEDSSMTRLRGEFAMILLVKHPDAPLDRLRKSLEPIRDNLKLIMGLRELKGADLHPQAVERDSFHISVYGKDTVGIVHAISKALAARNANITDLRTALAGTEDEPLYVMQIEAEAAPGEDAEALTNALKDAGRTLGVDVSVELLESAAL